MESVIYLKTIKVATLLKILVSSTRIAVLNIRNTLKQLGNHICFYYQPWQNVQELSLVKLRHLEFQVIHMIQGGVGNYIINGVNGYRLPEGCGAEVFANKIIETLTTENQNKLHNGCLKMYESTLSWNSWSLRFRKIIEMEIYK